MDKFYLGVMNNNIARTFQISDNLKGQWVRIARHTFGGKIAGGTTCDVSIIIDHSNSGHAESYDVKLSAGGGIESNLILLGSCARNSNPYPRIVSKIRNNASSSSGADSCLDIFITDNTVENLTLYVSVNNGADNRGYWNIVTDLSPVEVEVLTYSELSLLPKCRGTAEYDSDGNKLKEYYYNKDNKPSKNDVGLDKVPNVATNDQTPTFTKASSLTDLTSGEKLSVAFGKIAKGISDLISHLSNKSNPHGVTATQVGMNVVDITNSYVKKLKTKVTVTGKSVLKQGNVISGHLLITCPKECIDLFDIPDAYRPQHIVIAYARCYKDEEYLDTLTQSEVCLPWGGTTWQLSGLDSEYVTHIEMSFCYICGV